MLERTPPELSADIIDRGIILTGGGAMIHGLDQLLAEELKVPVLLADEPMNYSLGKDKFVLYMKRFYLNVCF